MRTMTSAEMRAANGGKYRYFCIVCKKKFRTSFIATIHGQFKHGWSNIRYIDDPSHVLWW